MKLRAGPEGGSGPQSGEYTVVIVIFILPRDRFNNDNMTDSHRAADEPRKCD